MKKPLMFIAILIVTLLSVSCTSSRWTTINMDDKEMVEKALNTNPELRERCQKGEIVIDKIKYQHLEDGRTKYRFTYSIIYNDDDNELLEWMLIFAPVLNN